MGKFSNKRKQPNPAQLKATAMTVNCIHCKDQISPEPIYNSNMYKVGENKEGNDYAHMDCVWRSLGFIK